MYSLDGNVLFLLLYRLLFVFFCLACLSILKNKTQFFETVFVFGFIKQTKIANVSKNKSFDSLD